jgi:hypothetical protein
MFAGCNALSWYVGVGAEPSIFTMELRRGSNISLLPDIKQSTSNLEETLATFPNVSWSYIFFLFFTVKSGGDIILYFNLARHPFRMLVIEFSEVCLVSKKCHVARLFWVFAVFRHGRKHDTQTHIQTASFCRQHAIFEISASRKAFSVWHWPITHHTSAFSVLTRGLQPVLASEQSLQSKVIKLFLL